MSEPHDNFASRLTLGALGQRPFPYRRLGPMLHMPLARAATAINDIEISLSDPGAVPGASTQARSRAGFGGGEIGSTGDPKGDLLLGMIPPLSGQTYSCE